jgi:glycosyltransferase involved in cell wall biosynthesis
MEKRMQNKLISIITPNYNYANYISKCIESVVAEQDYDNIEHIIIDDGSSDNSADIINQFLNRYPEKIKFIKQSNQGHVKTVNVGFKRAKGDIIGWLNSDDFYCERIFSAIIKRFDENESLDIIYGDYNIVNKEGKLLFKNPHLDFDYRMATFKGFGNVLTSNAIFWRKSLFDRVGYLDESFIFTPDNDFFARLTLGTTIEKINIPLANYRKHEKTITVTSSLTNNEKRIEEHKRVFRYAYSQTNLANFIPLKFASLLKPYYLCKRIFSRVIKGHYIPHLRYNFSNLKASSKNNK